MPEDELIQRLSAWNAWTDSAQRHQEIIREIIRVQLTTPLPTPPVFASTHDAQRWLDEHAP